MTANTNQFSSSSRVKTETGPSSDPLSGPLQRSGRIPVFRPSVPYVPFHEIANFNVLSEFNQFQKALGRVYLYINPLTDAVFYVGKGKGRRVLDHLIDAKGTEKTKTIEEIRAGHS